jgi:hypothetical protein
MHVLNMCLFFEEAHESTQDGVNKLVDKGPNGSQPVEDVESYAHRFSKWTHCAGIPSADVLKYEEILKVN